MVDSIRNAKQERRPIPVPALVEAMKDAGVSAKQVEKVLASTEPKLITVEEAAEKFDIAQGRIEAWIQRGHLKVRDRQRGFYRGGGVRLIDEIELKELIAHAPRIGRPPKKMLNTY